MTNRIIIHRANEEGAFHVSSLSGQVLTPAEEMPLWASGYSTAVLQSRREFYTKRLGAQATEELLHPQAIDAQDLDWIAVDEAGDDVEVSHSPEFRLSVIAALFDIDTSSEEAFEAQMAGAIQRNLVDHTYTTDPTTEETLSEVEGKGFTEVAKAAQG